MKQLLTDVLLAFDAASVIVLIWLVVGCYRGIKAEQKV